MRTLERRSGRGGFALPVAILALVVVGVLVTGGFFMAQQETRIGVASQHGSMAFYIAEQGINEVLGNWAAATYSSIPLWGSDTVPGSIPQGSYSVQVHHLTDVLYFLESEGTVTQGGRLAGATRKIGLLARIQTAWIDPPAALTTRGNTELRGTAEVDGVDRDPPNWPECDGSLDNKPGIMSDGSGTILSKGSSDINGDPDTVIDPSIDDSTFLDYGDLTWDDLIELADAAGMNVTSLGSPLTPVPSLTGSGACNTGDKLNWGEPWRSAAEGAAFKAACTSYFPLVYHEGDPELKLNGNSRGQGILLVGEVQSNGTHTGNLNLNGGFTWMGIIITLGQYETQAGQSPRIMGGVMAGNAALGGDSTQVLTGGGETLYSSCAIEQAILNNSSLANARPIQNRSWVDLTNVRR